MRKRSGNKYLVYLLYTVMIVMIVCGCRKKEEEEKSDETENTTLDNRVSIVEEQLDSIENLLIEIETSFEEAKRNQSDVTQKNDFLSQNEVVENTASPTSFEGKTTENGDNKEQTVSPGGTEDTEEADGMENEVNSDQESDQTGQKTSVTTQSTGNSQNQGSTKTPTMTTPQNAISVTATGIDVDFDSYLAVINALEEDVNQANINGVEAYHKFKMRINEIEAVFDVIDEELESFYQNGKITKSQYASLDSELDVLEDKLERIEDNLEERYGIDD